MLFYITSLQAKSIDSEDRIGNYELDEDSLENIELSKLVSAPVRMDATTFLRHGDHYQYRAADKGDLTKISDDATSMNEAIARVDSDGNRNSSGSRYDGMASDYADSSSDTLFGENIILNISR